MSGLRETTPLPATDMLLPTQRYAAGLVRSHELAVPLGATRACCVVDRRDPSFQAYAQTDLVALLSLELSLDSGTTWSSAGGCGMNGGVHRRQDATLATMSSLTVPLPAPDQPQRRLRVAMELLRPVTLDCRVEVR